MQTDNPYARAAANARAQVHTFEVLAEELEEYAPGRAGGYRKAARHTRQRIRWWGHRAREFKAHSGA